MSGANRTDRNAIDDDASSRRYRSLVPNAPTTAARRCHRLIIGRPYAHYGNGIGVNDTKERRGIAKDTSARAYFPPSVRNRQQLRARRGRYADFRSLTTERNERVLVAPFSRVIPRDADDPSPREPPGGDPTGERCKPVLRGAPRRGQVDATVQARRKYNMLIDAQRRAPNRVTDGRVESEFFFFSPFPFFPFVANLAKFRRAHATTSLVRVSREEEERRGREGGAICAISRAR